MENLKEIIIKRRIQNQFFAGKVLSRQEFYKTRHTEANICFDTSLCIGFKMFPDWQCQKCLRIL